MKKYLFISMFIVSFVHAQENSITNIDSLASAVADTTQIDSLTNKDYEVDAIVESSASDSLFFDLKNKKMYIYGDGKLKHKQTELQSGEIILDFETNDLDAKGIIDADTLKQTPILVENGETYEGSSIKYNFKTQKGFISVAKNVKGEASYTGAKVKKVDRNTFFVENGIYTTCAGDPPQTHFQASEMKVIQKDKVIAKWVFMYIAGVPLPIPLPFAVFPTESGRRSGLIIPTYGATNSEGQYFRNFGYFFALSNYFDLKLTGDYYTKGGFGIHGNTRYKKRYSFDGSINADYSYQKRNEPNDPDRTENTQWKFSVFHRQSFNPTSSLDVNLQFQSGEYFNQNSTNFNELLTQNITSNATFRKNWDESGNSMVLNYQRTQNLENGDITEYLPNLNFNKKFVYPFKKDGNSRDQAWYEYLGYSYSGKLSNRRKKTGGNLNVRAGLQHDIQASASPKIGYFNISPRFSYQEKWYNKRIKKEYKTVETQSDSGIVSERKLVDTDINELNAVRTFDFSISASTKLYGIMQPNMLGIEAFRHTLIPSVSYNINPDFSNDSWGYYDSYVDENGNIVKYDKFGNEIFRGANAGETQNISFSLGNIFEIKTIKNPTDTTSQSEKIQLLNFDIRTSYNFAADSIKFSDLSLSYRTQIGDLLSFSGNSSYTFYAFNGSTAINKLLASEGRGLFRLKNLGFSISTRLSGDKLENEKRTGINRNEFNDEENNNNDIIQQNTNSAKSLYDKQENDFSIPWNLSLDYNYNLNKVDPNNPIKSSTIGMNLGFNLTKNWKFTVRGSYDLIGEEVAAPAVTVYRDLGCWEMNFSWNPLGRYRGYNFTVRLKAPELQDIKVTKSDGLYTGRR